MATAEEYANWIVKNQDKAGTPEFETVANAYRLARGNRAPIKDNLTAESLDPSEGMSALDKFRAGMGKAIVDTGRGLGQLVGAVSRKDVAESRERDRPLMESGMATAGNIAGVVGTALTPGIALKGASLIPQLASVAPALAAAGGVAMAPTTIPSALAVGGLMGVVQPSTSTAETIGNTMLGAGGAALFPAIGKAAQTAKAAAEPLYKGGQDKILRRLVDKVAGGEAATVAQRVDDAFQPAVGPFLPGEAKKYVGELVPGSVPTLAQAAQNPGVGALERTLAATNPEVGRTISDRLAAQNVARVNALQSPAGDRAAAVAARETATNALYDAAKAKTVEMDKALETLMSRPSMKSAWGKAQELAKERGEKIAFPGLTAKEVAEVGADGVPKIVGQAGKPSEASVRGLHYLKLAMDDMLNTSATSNIGKNQASAITETKKLLLDWLEAKVPEYGAAREAYKALSRPINQADVVDEIASKSINRLTGTLQPAAYARALDDSTAARATGFKGATLKNTFDQRQLAALQAIKDDVARAVAAQNVGRGVGSDTVQKLAYSNLIDAAGVPSFIRNNPAAQVAGNVIGRAGDALYGRANREMSQRLAELVADPQGLAALLRSAPTADPMLLQNLLRGGATTGMLTPAITSAQR